TTDVIENAGVERSLEKMRQADLVIYLFDVNTQAIADLRLQIADLASAGIKYVLVANKIDELGEAESKNKFDVLEKVIFISAKLHLHTEVLKERMVDTVLQGKVQAESTIITNARHFHALKEVEKSLIDIKNGLDKKLPGDLLSLDTRRCLHYLGEITGEITNEDQLDYIFSKFCIGK
ncbi:MAG: tRNA uridine-5-carboxymethylaminomethyl(34) synthesis GTPase MnmE, partial [Chitinophagaceae bacterium]